MLCLPETRDRQVLTDDVVFWVDGRGNSPTAAQANEAAGCVEGEVGGVMLITQPRAIPLVRDD